MGRLKGSTTQYAFLTGRNFTTAYAYDAAVVAMGIDAHAANREDEQGQTTTPPKIADEKKQAAETAIAKVRSDCHYSDTETDPKKINKQSECVARAIAAQRRKMYAEKAQSRENGPFRTLFSLGFWATSLDTDGKFERFRVELSPVIEKPLESQGFETITYKGIGIDDPNATIRFEQAFDGFHAMVRSARGVFYIDPTTKAQKQANQGPYVSYFASARPGLTKRGHCEVSGEQAKQKRAPAGKKTPPGKPTPQPISFIAPGLRIYRLAVAVNSYYVAAVYDRTLPASPFDQAAAAVTRTINRINGIYESEFGVRLNLISNEGRLIYVNRGADPYRDVNTDSMAALPVNQSNLDNVIGSENYDIGHLFATKTSGRASLRSVCNPGSKAQGVTGLENPTGDSFDVDYVSHEIGHQFGANHTFNAITGGCKDNRYEDTAYEPGSGSTIMGYAGPGICDPESLQDHSDAYFHLASLLEVENFIGDASAGGGGSCGTSTALSFAPPSVSASGTYTVPKGTAFVLTAELPDALNQADVCVDGTFFAAVPTPTLTSAVLTPKPPATALAPGVTATLAVQGMNLTPGDTQIFGLGATVTLSVATGTTGSVDLTLPADYKDGAKVYLSSLSNPGLISSTVVATAAQPHVQTPTLASALLRPKTSGQELKAGVQATLTIQGTNLVANDTEVIGLGTTVIKIMNVIGDVGTVDVTLPADYKDGQKVHLVSASNSALSSSEVAIGKGQ